MKNNWNSDRNFIPLAWPVALLGVGGAVGLWFWPVHGVSVQGLLTPAILILAAILGIVWQFRARAAQRRLRAALDAFAEREITRVVAGFKPAPHVAGTRRRGQELFPPVSVWQRPHIRNTAEQAKRAFPRRNLHARPQSQDR